MRRTILLTLLVVLTAAGTAHASAAQALRDCNDNGRLDQQYSQKDLREALANIPSDLDQYSNCRRVIKQAQLAGVSGGGDTGAGGGGAPGGGGPTDSNDPSAGGTTSSPGDFGGFSGVPADPLATATPEEHAALDQIRAVEPPTLNRSASIAGSDLPAPLWVVLAIGALGLIALIATDVRRRVIARRAG